DPPRDAERERRQGDRVPGTAGVPRAGRRGLMPRSHKRRRSGERREVTNVTGTFASSWHNMATVAGPGCRRPFGRAVRVWLLDERLYLIESEIARLRDLLYTSNQ